MSTRWLNRLRVFPRLIDRLTREGVPVRSLIFGPLSIGDDLLCSAVLREARRRGVPFSMFTNRPELFAGNADPSSIHSIDDHYLALLQRLGRTVIYPYYATTDPEVPDRDILPSHHVIAEMCRLAGLTGEVSIRPYLHLSPAEIAAAPRLPRQIAIQSSAASAAIPFANKEWGVDRFAALAPLLAKTFSLVQIGAAADPLLPGVALDLRGRTTLREAAAVQATSLLFIGLEGFLTHLARAVDCPSVVILGGRASAEQVGYSANVHLSAPMPCSPCSLRNTCRYDLACLRGLSVETVAEAVHPFTVRPRSPLPVDIIQI